MAVMQAMVNGPPQRPLLERGATGEGEQELEPARGLERMVREVAVQPDGDAEPDDPRDDEDRQYRPPGKLNERDGHEREMDREERRERERDASDAVPYWSSRRGRGQSNGSGRHGDAREVVGPAVREIR